MLLECYAKRYLYIYADESQKANVIHVLEEDSYGKSIKIT